MTMNYQFSNRPFITFALLAPLLLLSPAWAMDQLVVRQEDQQIYLKGKVLVTAEDGGLLLLAPDGELWAVEPDHLIRRSKTPEPFAWYGKKELSKRILETLPEGFELYTTSNYLICYNTSRAYAQWCGALFERLNRAARNFWTRKGFKLIEPEGPLVALVFADRKSYQEYAKSELGEASRAIVGYYSLRTNRITMYDLTGVETLRGPGNRRGSLREINAMLSRPAAEPMVATIVHEATHQIAFNSGLHTRYSDIPLWVSEGIAIYFETPDLKSSKGWRGIGTVNRPRLTTFQKNLGTRRSDSLARLITDDRRMRNVDTAADAYAEAWSLTYYLIRHRSKQYLAYLEMLSKKKALVWNDPTDRAREFEAFFGDMKTLDASFIRSLQKLR